MMLMFLGKHKRVFRKTLQSFQENIAVFLVNECKSASEIGIILYKTAIFGLFFGLFWNVKDS
jgi:hypothetical protein